jgi:hypothetical protein
MGPGGKKRVAIVDSGPPPDEPAPWLLNKSEVATPNAAQGATSPLQVWSVYLRVASPVPGASLNRAASSEPPVASPAL